MITEGPPEVFGQAVNRAGADEHEPRPVVSGPQLGLGLEDPYAPPPTRAGCAGIARPCNRYACKHHLWPEDERAGRPWHGAPPTTLVPKPSSCALDVAEGAAERAEQDDGNGVAMDYAEIGTQLAVTRRRAQQIGDRALVKVGLGQLLEQAVEDLHTMLVERAPPALRGKFRLDMAYPAQTESGTMLVTLVFAIDAEATAPPAPTRHVGVQIRRRTP